MTRRAFWAIAAAGLVVAGCGAADTPTTATPAAQTTVATDTISVPAPKVAHHRRHHRTLAEEQQAMEGDWVAVGNVLRAKDQYNLIPGDQLERRWRIIRDCRSGTCRMFLTRETAYVPVTSELRRDGHLWRATFDQRIPKANGEVQLNHSVWTVELNGPRIAAVEREKTSGTCECRGATLAIRWVATK